MGRFINADTLVSTGQGVLGNNMFAYCNNNPVRYVDRFGTEPEEEIYDNNPKDDLFPDGGGTASGTAGSACGNKGVSVINILKGLIDRPMQKGKVILSTSDALDLAISYLGKGYKEEDSGRYVSADGTRQVRMADHDIACTNNAPHINFDINYPRYKTEHVFFYDDWEVIK